MRRRQSASPAGTRPTATRPRPAARTSGHRQRPQPGTLSIASAATTELTSSTARRGSRSTHAPTGRPRTRTGTNGTPVRPAVAGALACSDSRATSGRATREVAAVPGRQRHITVRRSQRRGEVDRHLLRGCALRHRGKDRELLSPQPREGLGRTARDTALGAAARAVAPVAARTAVAVSAAPRASARAGTRTRPPAPRTGSSTSRTAAAASRPARPSGRAPASRR